MGMASMSFAASSLDAAALGYTCLAAALGIGVATLYRKLKEYEDEAAALSRTT